MNWLRRGERPGWSMILAMLGFGIALAGFGNADRVLWRATSFGADLPGVVVDIRSYRLPDQPQEIRVPKVAFRNAQGVVRIMEPEPGTWRGRVAVDQPVLVALREEGRAIVIDVPFQRRPLTSALLWALTMVGLTAWARAIFLLIKRIAMANRSPRELA